MKTSSLFTNHEWCIIENQFNPENHQIAESIFSIGNGHMGQRANFEESYSGKTLAGNYIGGVFYPDKTRVGWWKNGYPDYFAKVLNAPSWTHIHIRAQGEMCDLARSKVLSFKRTLNMQHGTLHRICTIELANKIQLTLESTRFVSIVDTEIGAIQYKITAVNSDVPLEVNSFITSDVRNEDANYNETFWETVTQEQKDTLSILVDKTKKTPYKVPVFTVATGMKNIFYAPGNTDIQTKYTSNEKNICEHAQIVLKKGTTVIIEKLATQVSSLHYAENELLKIAEERLQNAAHKTFSNLHAEHIHAWKKKWELSDIQIEGDIAAQQGIRFSIFQLQQTYTGADSRLNIGPKGFTGEKYGGATYWDTEAFCLPFYLATSPEQVSKNLLLYRYTQLPQAIENAEKLGFTNGAALYPMVTMTGEECHNEWEITFEEIHRNGAIAYAIYNYVNYTDDKAYLIEYGLEVLIAINRFWAQRASFSQIKKKYVILGVTGPNEYENNINNNWYTNYIARWCINYTLEIISWIKRVAPEQYAQLIQKITFNENLEIIRWTDIAKNIYLPTDNQYGLILQQEGYLDKEQKTIDELPSAERPINQHWSWDRILRSCYIKQADVVQGLYMFENDFDIETIRRNFDFYEARCVHESSLSPCIHSVVASKLQNIDKAYELYLRTSRLDLDDYNKEAHEGLHVTSMSGSWLAIVQGFAGMRVEKGKLMFNPILPKQWKSYSFFILFRNALIKVSVHSKYVHIRIKNVSQLFIHVYSKEYDVRENEELTVAYQEIVQ